MAALDDTALTFIDRTRTASMITLRRDGTAHAVRVGVAVVDGKIWSSGTQARVRTHHLRRDPRATLFVFDAQWRWLTVESDVRILDGPDAPALNLRFFQHMQPQAAPGKLAWFGADRTHDEFLQIMREERRLMYEFEPRRVYGMYGDAP